MEHFIEFPDGRRFGLATYGAEGGLPILALHGAPASRIMFDVADEPAKRLGLTLYCPERPGYGATPNGGEPTLATRVMDLAAIVDKLSLDRFAVVGVSGGGPYAVALSALLQDRVAGLGLVSPVGPIAQFASAHKSGAVDDRYGELSHGHRMYFLELPKHRRLAAIQAEIGAHVFKVAPQPFTKVFARTLTESDTQILSKPHVQQSLVSMTLEALRQGPAGGLADLKIYSKPWQVDFDSITAPAILWQGTRDRIVPAAVSMWLSELIPNCRLERLEGSGHFWIYDHVAEVLAAIAEISSPGLAQGVAE
jgi:pimeloyl-ACP methyl ester carboxylesterase